MKKKKYNELHVGQNIFWTKPFTIHLAKHSGKSACTAELNRTSQGSDDWAALEAHLTWFEKRMRVVRSDPNHLVMEWPLMRRGFQPRVVRWWPHRSKPAVPVIAADL